MVTVERKLAKGGTWNKHSTSTFAMMVFSVPAIITYCIGAPFWFYLRGIDAFSHLFSVLLLGVLPVALSMSVARLIMTAQWKQVAKFTLWDWLGLSVAVVLGQWGGFMGVSVVALFVFPASVMDQVAGAFYYYMVPLIGLNWLALFVYAIVVYVVFKQTLLPAQKGALGEPVFRFSKPTVLAVLPVSLIIYGIFQWLFYHFVPG